MQTLPEQKNIYMMLGEMSADIKTLVKGQENMWEKLGNTDKAIVELQTGEAVRIARAGVLGTVFGFIGGGMASGIMSYLKAKFPLL